MVHCLIDSVTRQARTLENQFPVLKMCTVHEQELRYVSKVQCQRPHSLLPGCIQNTKYVNNQFESKVVLTIIVLLVDER